MAMAKITTKGQVTIPKEIRESLKLHAGDKLEIVVTGEREAVIRPVAKKVAEVFRKLHRSGKKAVSLEAMNDAVRKRMKEKFS